MIVKERQLTGIGHIAQQTRAEQRGVSFTKESVLAAETVLNDGKSLSEDQARLLSLHAHLPLELRTQIKNGGMEVIVDYTGQMIRRNLTPSK